MMAQGDPTAEAIDDARAFMDALLKSDWQELHIAGGDFELFIARKDGGPNPKVDSDFAGGADTPSNALAPTEIAAPHVATLAWIAAVGTQIESGEPLACLSVLDEETIVKAGRAGRVVGALAEAGQLVEFGTVLVLIAEEP